MVLPNIERELLEDDKAPYRGVHQLLVTIFFIRVTKPPSIKFSSHVSSILQITIYIGQKIFLVFTIGKRPKKCFFILKELFLDKEGRVQDSLFFVEFWQPFSVLKASRNAMKLVNIEGGGIIGASSVHMTKHL